MQAEPGTFMEADLTEYAQLAYEHAAANANAKAGEKYFYLDDLVTILKRHGGQGTLIAGIDKTLDAW